MAIGTVGKNRICLATTCGLLIGGIASSRFRRYAFAAAAISGAYTAYRGHSQFNERTAADWTKKLLADAKKKYRFQTDATSPRDQYKALSTFIRNHHTELASEAIAVAYHDLQAYYDSVEGSKIEGLSDLLPDRPKTSTNLKELNDAAEQMLEWFRSEDEIHASVTAKLNELSTDASRTLLTRLNLIRKTSQAVEEIKHMRLNNLRECQLDNFKPRDAKNGYGLVEQLKKLKNPRYDSIPTLDAIIQQVEATKKPIAQLVEIGEAILGLKKPPLTLMDQVKGAAALLAHRTYTPSFLR